MFGLLSTFFLVGLCCSSAINNTLDHKQSDNEINIQESNNIKYFNYNDEYGIQLYCTSADFMSYDFISTFLFNIPTDTIDIMPTSSNLGTLNFTTVGKIYSASFGAIGNVLYDIDTISLIKTYTNTSSPSSYSVVSSSYRLDFISNNTTQLRYTFSTSIPLVGRNEDDLGFSVYGVYDNITPSTTWYYFENNNDNVFTPIINYYYKIRTDERVTINNNNFQNGYAKGKTDGYNNGYQVGYADGLNDTTYSETATTIFNGIFTVAMLPVNVFLGFMNFEVFGINISGLVSGLITVALVFIILRFIFGGKGGKND